MSRYISDFPSLSSCRNQRLAFYRALIIDLPSYLFSDWRNNCDRSSRSRKEEYCSLHTSKSVTNSEEVLYRSRIHARSISLRFLGIISSRDSNLGLPYTLLGQRTIPPTELRCTVHPKEIQEENIVSVKTGFLLPE